MVDERQFPDGYKSIRVRIDQALEDMDDLATRFAPDLLPANQMQGELEAENAKLKDTLRSIQDLILNKMVAKLRELEDTNTKLQLQLKNLQEVIAGRGYAPSRPVGAPIDNTTASPFARAYLESQKPAPNLTVAWPEPASDGGTTDHEEKEIAKALASLEGRPPPAASGA